MYRSFVAFIPIQNTKSCVNVFSEGSPILIRSVRRISFGITMRPRSSIRLTIPVAFILLLQTVQQLVNQESSITAFSRRTVQDQCFHGITSAMFLLLLYHISCKKTSESKRSPKFALFSPFFFANPLDFFFCSCYNQGKSSIFYCFEHIILQITMYCAVMRID